MIFSSTLAAGSQSNLQLSSILAAGSRFGKYNPEPEREVRSFEVKGDELDYLRAKRDLLRSMPPEQAFSVIEFYDHLPFPEAVALAKKEGKIIVPNDVIDRILTETESKITLVTTGTAVIYPALGKAFGKRITYDGFVFNIPKQFRRRVDCALVVESPDFELVKLRNHRYELVAHNVHLLENFPANSQTRHRYDKKFRIPVESEVRADTLMRKLMRITGSYIGSVTRTNDLGWGRDVGIVYGWSGIPRVALF